MSQIKHDDDWLDDNAPRLARMGTYTREADSEAIRFAERYLEHMTRVRVTADELPESGSQVLAMKCRGKRWSVDQVLEYCCDAEEGEEWLNGACCIEPAPDGWQPILRSGGGE